MSVPGTTNEKHENDPDKIDGLRAEFLKANMKQISTSGKIMLYSSHVNNIREQ